MALGLREKETPAMVVHTTSQTIEAGKRSVTIITDGSFAGTILGATAAASKTYSWTAQPGNILDEIAIVITAGSCTVLTTT